MSVSVCVSVRCRFAHKRLAPEPRTLAGHRRPGAEPPERVEGRLAGLAVKSSRWCSGGLDVEGPAGDDHAERVDVRVGLVGLVGPAERTGHVTDKRAGRLPPDLRLTFGGLVG